MHVKSLNFFTYALDFATQVEVEMFRFLKLKTRSKFF